MAAATATRQTTRSGLMATMPEHWFEYRNLKELKEQHDGREAAGENGQRPREP